MASKALTLSLCPTFKIMENVTNLPELGTETMQQIHNEKIPVEGGVRLDGKWCPFKINKQPWLTTRSAFMHSRMAKGELLNVCYQGDGLW